MAVSKIDARKGFGLKALIYGPPNSGKTFLAGSANEVPEMRDVLVLSLSGGAKATLRDQQHEGILLDNDLRFAKEAEAEIWKLKSRAAGYENVKTVILDDVSEVAKAELEQIRAEAVKSGRRESQDESQLKDFMVRQSRVLRMMRMARDLPMNVIATAWSREIKSESGKTLQVVPDFSDGTYKTLFGYFDSCWFVENTDRRYLYTANYGLFQAKTRGREFAQELGESKDGKFLPRMADPSFQKIVAAFSRAYTKEQK